MVDAVSGVAKIVGVALKIKEAASTARQNKKDCHHIKCRVDVLNKTLSHHENNADLMEDPAVKAALEALDGILAEALEVITECQEERTIVCVYCTAGKLSRQLSKMEQRVSYLSSDAMLTIMSYHLLRKSREDAPYQPPQPKEGVAVAPFGEWDAAIFNRMRDDELSHDSSSKQFRPRRGFSSTPPSAATSAPPSQHRPNAAQLLVLPPPLPAPPRSPSASYPAHKTAGEPRSLSDRIAVVVGNIEEAVETVVQNREECLEIGELANRVGTLLSHLQGKKMMDELAMRGALEKLLATFRRAHTLVIACQRRGFALVWLSSPSGRLSTQLHEVMDKIASRIADMAAILLT